MTRAQGLTTDVDPVIARVRRALGRTEPLADPPMPPPIEEPIVRLVHTDLGLPELFAQNAKALKMLVTKVSPEELAPSIAAFLRDHNCRQIGLSESVLLDQLGVDPYLRAAGFEVRRWSQMTLDDAYGIDAAVTDVWKVVAETGSLVLRASPGQGRVLTLTPFIHIAVVEPKNFLPDLLDLFEAMQSQGVGTASVIVAGPSKTSDIELTLVTGVHGPNIVQTFILQ